MEIHWRSENLIKEVASQTSLTSSSRVKSPLQSRDLYIVFEIRSKCQIPQITNSLLEEALRGALIKNCALIMSGVLIGNLRYFDFENECSMLCYFLNIFQILCCNKMFITSTNMSCQSRPKIKGHQGFSDSCPIK